MKYLIGFIIVLLPFWAYPKQDKLDFKAWEESGGWGFIIVNQIVILIR
ncbi:hypothetical protein [Xenorhabdus cabanillasii]|uniref:Uncharacterized protein n=2 Tax=Xenorhabdus cabanillasii TaxID=351673 RepID=A0A3D9UB71_9GAMM|nr:hypothetical protein [Xenorhabdus cabanillasii]PHM77002.1 hypothetical protein Xcab_02420 [Xenorhabdus cabanillasii JM26]REF26639.1 hypothetical protein BDD26_1309 [Xenorhabdus cabanillasii]CDL85957.1 hypothetical protein XCR1_2650036 [Xenorhabdus cabanillasii JM26]